PAVQRLEVAYDTAGRLSRFTSLDGAGNVVNQVEQVYNGLGQLAAEYQSHAGAVTAGSPQVQYGYSFSDTPGAPNHSRLTSITYPNGRVLSYNYAAGLDDTISRLSALSDASGPLEAYTYLGLSNVVRRAYPQPGIELSYIDPNGQISPDSG